MKKNTIIVFGLLFMVLFSFPLLAQSGSYPEGYDYDGRAIVALLPFIGDEKDAAAFNDAVAGVVAGFPKYSPRRITAATVSAAGVRIPVDMPPVPELTPGARYALTGGVYPGNHADEYYLQLWLWDTDGSTMIYTDDLVYQDINIGLESLPGLVEWLFSHIVEKAVETEPVSKTDWDDKIITLGVRSGISRHWYTAPREDTPGAYSLNYEGGLFVTGRLNSLISLQGEINFSLDDVVYRGITNISGAGNNRVLDNEKYNSYSLMFPLLFKLNFRPGNFRLAPFGGLYVFLPLGKTSYRKNSSGEDGSYSWSADIPLGFTAGLETAMKLGPGMLLADIRYSGDFSTIRIHDTDTGYKRGMVSITLGYAFGFIRIKK
jgi:hypothetical protein